MDVAEAKESQRPAELEWTLKRRPVQKLDRIEKCAVCERKSRVSESNSSQVSDSILNGRPCRTLKNNVFENSSLLDKLMLRREFLCGPSRAINELGK